MGVTERFLVTGAMGCLGAWIVRHLVHDGVDVIGLDLSNDRRRLRLIQDEDELDGVEIVRGDITMPSSLANLIGRRGITHVIHGAALQVPFVRADPVRGASVNVLGTTSIFEAVRTHRDQVEGVAYASSAAVFGPAASYPDGRVDDDALPLPETLYGVFKLANEGTAAVYGREHGIFAVGLRPFVVYGPGRDAGMTAASTIAIAHALVGEAFEISPAGSMSFDYVADTAAAFVAAARLRPAESLVMNVPGIAADAADVVAAIEHNLPAARGQITVGEATLALPSIVDATRARTLLGLREPTPLASGVAQTIAILRRGLDRGLVAVP